MSVNSTSPSTLFGGTWEQVKDRFLLSAGSTYSAGNTGGNASINFQHNHTYGIHYGQHYGNTTGASGENLGLYNNGSYKYGGTASGTNSTYYLSGTSATTARTTYKLTASTSNSLSTSVNILPPYLVVYVWKRTA